MRECGSVVYSYNAKPSLPEVTACRLILYKNRYVIFEIAIGQKKS